MLIALAYHPAAHAQRIPTVAAAVLAALLLSPLLAVALKWVTLRRLRAASPGRGLWLAMVADYIVWLAGLPAAWSLWHTPALPASLIGLLVLAVLAHRMLVYPVDGSPHIARNHFTAWCWALVLALEAPLLGLLLATIVWLAVFF